jgi:formylglycine-generating enzyme required for sulfatase activity
MTSHHLKTPPNIPGYQFTRLIGLGGMGEVYLASQLTLNRPVAIKFLSRNAGEPPDEYDLRFRREAELMARVSHPNVVTIFDYGTAGGRPYLVMEYVEAGDLRSRMIPESPMKVEEILAITRPVIRAMQYLHRQGIVHRDLKPENILIHHEETPKVTDFGLAVLDFAVGSLTRTGRSMGTPGYVAPEQQYGLRVDERADQFSMAALCYEMATGRKPLGASYPPPSRLNPKLSRAADAVIRKGLSEDPDDRFATIGEFGEALERGLAKAPGRPGHGRRTALFAGAALVALAAAGLYFAGIVPRNGPARVQPPADPGPGPTAVPPPRLVAKSVGLELVLIPAGEFSMGSPRTDNGARDEEFPSHRVRISRPFYLGEKEVTVGQFRAFVKAAEYPTTVEKNRRGGCKYNVQLSKFEQKPEYNWRNPGSPRPQSDDEPVIQVSWEDAVAFCAWLSKVEGRPYRLPTEAEWEYACRAGTTTRWSSGDDVDSLDRFAWTLRDAGDAFHPVGSKDANRWGLFDMHGNVWEWCHDWFGKYGDGVAVDPVGPPSGDQRVLRGGSFDWDKVERTRSASRLCYPPYMSYYNYGFRVCSPTKP